MYTTSITDLRKKLNWLNTEDSINYKILTILKKTITYNLPYNLRNKIKHKPNTRLLRNNNSTILHLPITHASNTKGENSALHQQLDGINYPRNLEIKMYQLISLKRNLKNFLSPNIDVYL